MWTVFFWFFNKFYTEPPFSRSRFRRFKPTAMSEHVYNILNLMRDLGKNIGYEICILCSVNKIPSSPAGRRYSRFSKLFSVYEQSSIGEFYLWTNISIQYTKILLIPTPIFSAHSISIGHRAILISIINPGDRAHSCMVSLCLRITIWPYFECNNNCTVLYILFCNKLYYYRFAFCSTTHACELSDVCCVFLLHLYLPNYLFVQSCDFYYLDQ